MTPRSSRFQMVWILLYSGPNLSSGLFMSGYRPFLDDQPAAGDAGGEHGGLRLGGEDGGDVAGARAAGGGGRGQPHPPPPRRPVGGPGPPAPPPPAPAGAAAPPPARAAGLA